MTAQVIEFASASQRVRIKRACRSTKPKRDYGYTTVRATEILRELGKSTTVDDRLRAVYKHGSCTGCGSPIGIRQTLAIKRDRGNISVYCKTCAREPQPEVLLSVGVSGEWSDCCQCHCEITPDQHCARDLLADLTWCLVCWPVTK